jgi:hypothetical protein
MDYTIFAHLKPKQRTDGYAARVARFMAKCREDPVRENAYCQICRCQRSIDCCDENQHLLVYRNGVDWYRVRTKIRRAEVRRIVYLLSYLKLYRNFDLEVERDLLIAAGLELMAVYDKIIEECS